MTVSFLQDESQWPKVVADRRAQGSEKWLTFTRLCLFEILEKKIESVESVHVEKKIESVHEYLEKLFNFSHFLVDIESIGNSHS